MPNNGVNKALAIARSTVKSGARIFADALPIVSIGANLAEAYQAYPDSPRDLLNTVVMRYTGVNPATGRFSKEELMKGTGSLLISVGARWVLKQLL